MGFFKKLTSGVSNVFKKAGTGADNFFKKASSDITMAADKTGRGIVMAGDKVGGALKQTGNILEKAAPILSDVGAGVAVLAGQPELAAPILAAGNSASMIGGRAKRAGSQVQSTSQVAYGTIQNKAGAFTGVINDANAKLQQANRSVTNRIDAAGNASMTTPANALAAIHADLA
jgi:hypothetical protein